MVIIIIIMTIKINLMMGIGILHTAAIEFFFLWLLQHSLVTLLVLSFQAIPNTSQ